MWGNGSLEAEILVETTTAPKKVRPSSQDARRKRGRLKAIRVNCFKPFTCMSQAAKPTNLAARNDEAGLTT